MAGNLTNVTLNARTLQLYQIWGRFLTYHTAITCCIVVLIICGNMITLISLFKFRHLRQQKYALIGSLSLADLFVGISTVTWLLYSMVYGGTTSWDAPDIMLTLSIYISGCHLYTIGIDRFIAVVKPLHYPMIVTKRTMIIMIVITWAYPTLLIIALYTYSLQLDSTTYAYVDRTHRIASMVSYLFNILVMSVLYGKILYETRLQVRKIQAMVDQNRNSSTHNNTVSNKGTRLVMIILSTAALLNFPYFVYAILKSVGTETSLSLMIMDMMVQQCVLASACINFFIYAAFNSEFRKAYITMLCYCKKNKNDPVVCEGDSVTYITNTDM